MRLVFPLANWKLEQTAGTANELSLTLQTPDGFEVAFSVDLQAIAQISQTSGSTLATPVRPSRLSQLRCPLSWYVRSGSAFETRGDPLKPQIARL